MVTFYKKKLKLTHILMSYKKELSSRWEIYDSNGLFGKELGDGIG